MGGSRANALKKTGSASLAGGTPTKMAGGNSSGATFSTKINRIRASRLQDRLRRQDRSWRCGRIDLFENLQLFHGYTEKRVCF